MARQINRLTDRTIKTIKTPGLHADGGNLYLRVDESGAKRWVCIFQWEGRRKEMGLGPYSLVSLAEAREDALAARKAVHRGINPIDARKAAKAKGKAQTFGDMLNEWLAQNEGGFRNPVHRRQWRTSVETYAGSLLELPIQKITTERVLEALKPIWNEKSETASRVRQRVEKIIDAARARGLFEGENPARWKGHLDHLLPARRKLTRGHHAALPYVDAPAFMAALRARKPLSARALQFTILTAARTSEALKAKWGEFDLENKVWTVPAERMKAGKEHRVPLSDAAIEAIMGGYPQTLEFREFGKRTFNRLLNKRTAHPLQFQQEDRRIIQKEDNFRKYVRDFLQKHAAVEDQLYRSAGLRLQFKDSELALKILSDFTASPKPIYPIHDSFMVLKRDENALRCIMESAFHASFGVYPCIR